MNIYDPELRETDDIKGHISVNTPFIVFLLLDFLVRIVSVRCNCLYELYDINRAAIKCIL